MSARILLVEDDPVSQDLLRNVLQARGYAVDAVGDGFAGLRLMAQKGYDLALVDYHLPELNGYASARLMRDAAHGGVVPKLVAITADRHGLTARSGAETLFDAILTKPIEPQPLFRFIETILDASGEHASAQAAARAFLRDPRHERARAAAEAFWRDRGLTGRPKALAVPQPTPEQALALSFCFQMGETDAADLIVLLDRAGIADLPALHERLPGRPTPVVDVTGQALEACDAAFRINDPSSWSEVAGLLNRFAARGARRATDPGGARRGGVRRAPPRVPLRRGPVAAARPRSVAAGPHPPRRLVHRARRDARGRAPDRAGPLDAPNPRTPAGRLGVHLRADRAGDRRTDGERSTGGAKRRDGVRTRDARTGGPRGVAGLRFRQERRRRSWRGRPD